MILFLCDSCFPFSSVLTLLIYKSKCMKVSIALVLNQSSIFTLTHPIDWQLLKDMSSDFINGMNWTMSRTTPSLNSNYYKTERKFFNQLKTN